MIDLVVALGHLARTVYQPGLAAESHRQILFPADAKLGRFVEGQGASGGGRPRGGIAVGLLRRRFRFVQLIPEGLRHRVIGSSFARFGRLARFGEGAQPAAEIRQF